MPPSNPTRDQACESEKGPPTAILQPEPGQSERGRRGRGHGQGAARGRREQNRPATLDEVRDKLEQLISDNTSLREVNARLLAKLANEERHSKAQHFSHADVYKEGDEDNEEYTQEEEGSITVVKATARTAGRKGSGNDTKRAKTGPNGERPPT